MKKNYLFVLQMLFYLFFLLSCQSAVKQKSLKEEIRSTPGRKLEDHSFERKTDLITRVLKKSDSILEYLKQYDGNPDYSIYIPSDEEMKVIENAINSLPPLNEKILKERLIGFYFVNHLLGTGFTDFILDENGEMYFFMAFNPTVFKKNLDEWLTYKDSTCFILNSPEDKIELKLNAKLSSFLGILLHESVHAVDYALNITPYVETASLPLMKNVKKTTPFVENVWKDYGEPKEGNLYPKREKVTFYKMNQGPHIPISYSQELYENLFKTDFVSLYGSLNWAEDLADLVMFYHLSEKMKNNYEVSVYRKNKKIYSGQPMKSEKIRNRFKSIEIFYQQ